MPDAENLMPMPESNKLTHEFLDCIEQRLLRYLGKTNPNERGTEQKQGHSDGIKSLKTIKALRKALGDRDD